MGTLLGLIVLAYGFAWLNLDRSAVARSLIWMHADVSDYLRFPSRVIASGDIKFNYAKAPEYPEALPSDVAPGYPDLSTLLEQSQTAAFIVIHNDRLVYERYFNGHHPDTFHTSFSVAKSFNSALIGAAIANGSISSIDEPVTTYIPELIKRDARFQAITIGNLLSMSSGLRYQTAGMPWGDDARTYYDPDLRHLAVQGSEIIEAPGERFHYNNYNPLLIGIVLERATGMHVSDYLSETLWKSLGATADASWSLDSEASGFEKMESGINARPIDFAKLGSLYLNRGMWQGSQLLPATWIDQSTHHADAATPSSGYQFGWWTFTNEALGDYYAAAGNKGQYVFVFPDDRLVIVRLGAETGGIDWVRMIPNIAQNLQSRLRG
ncbi:serine hydrolase [Mesorhizobium sp. SB112]|uniref:serine hydrolase domain-containing protein n=1 Tax=Mesorhizobium sp. SB112 TaxID=3151853 RepID=UPI0032664698